MLTRWTHLHTGTVGLLAGLAFAQGWWLAAVVAALTLLAFVGGVAAGRFWLATHRLRLRAVALLDGAERRREEAHRAKLAIDLARVDEVRRRADAKAAQAAAAQRVVAAKVEQAYTQGASDVLLEQAARNGKRRSR